MPACWIALGGNQGPVEETLGRAVDQIAEAAGEVVARSSFHHTLPVGEHAGEPFVNAAIEISTQLTPLGLLDELQQLESRCGRRRDVRWGPRPIDLDIIQYGSEVYADRRLELPHPAAWYRRFVLDPLVEIAPQLLHPIKQLTFQQLRARLLARPLSISLHGPPLKCSTVSDRVAGSFSASQLKLIDDPDPPTTLAFVLPHATESQRAAAVEPARLMIPHSNVPTEQFVLDAIQAALGNDA